MENSWWSAVANSARPVLSETESRARRTGTRSDMVSNLLLSRTRHHDRSDAAGGEDGLDGGDLAGGGGGKDDGVYGIAREDLELVGPRLELNFPGFLVHGENRVVAAQQVDVGLVLA